MKKANLWIEERHQDILSLRYDIKKILYSKKSPFQHVQVVETEGYGKMLFNDKIAMLSEKDEFVYHEMIAHVPLFVHSHPQNILVIGGGDGGTVREVLKHPQVKKCTLVEIDSCVVEACKKFIPQTASQLDHARVKVHIDDGVKYVKNTTEHFDVVLVDSTDPLGPAIPLFDSQFYQNIHCILNEDGIVVSQCESPFYEGELQASMMRRLQEHFPIVEFYNYSNLVYPGGLWSFLFSSKKYHPIEDYDAHKTKGWDFQYYNSGIHKAAFQLPHFMKKTLGRV